MRGLYPSATLLALAGAGFIACGGGSDVTTPTNTVASVRVTPATVTINDDQSTRLTAEALDAGGNVVSGQTFQFESNDTDIASFANATANPVTVVALSAGEAIITATTAGKSGTATVTVRHETLQATGRVVDGETQAGIGGAHVNYLIEYRQADGSGLTSDESGNTSAGADGSFSIPFDRVDPEEITIHLKATALAAGYVENTLDYEVISAEFPGIEPIVLVRENAAQGSISGAIRNARTNLGIAGATVWLFKGQGFFHENSPRAAQTVSDAEGGYTFTQLVAGTYTVQARATDFQQNQRTAIPVGTGVVLGQDVILAPQGTNQVVIVLTWSSNPSDLDAHLTGPNPDPSRFHVYYPSGSRGSTTEAPFAALDVDDVDSFGPETITITHFNSGVYRFSVHDYSNRGSASSNALASSGAKVVLFAQNFAREFFVPNQPGTLWTVFELSGDIDFPTVTTRDEMGFVDDPSGVLLRSEQFASGKGTDAGLIGRAIRAARK